MRGLCLLGLCSLSRVGVPNQGVQATAASVRSCLAPAFSRA